MAGATQDKTKAEAEAKAKAEAEAKAKAEAEAKAKAEAEAKAKAEVEAEAETMELTNNTKGLRHVVGFKVLPGQSVELTAEQVDLVMDNPVAKAWIEAGDLSLK